MIATPALLAGCDVPIEMHSPMLDPAPAAEAPAHGEPTAAVPKDDRASEAVDTHNDAGR